MYISKSNTDSARMDHIKVMIVDDHTLVVEGLKSLLANHEIVKVNCSFENGKPAIEYLACNLIDVVLLDINLPDINGIEVCQIIFKNHPNVKVIGLSTYSDRSIINQMISNGAKGYLLKNVSAEELITAITTVNNDGNYYGSEIQKLMADTIFQSMDQAPRLTKREKQILKLIAEGKTTNQIGEELFISPLTVETHRRNMMKKLKAPNVASLIKIATEKMLI